MARPPIGALEVLLDSQDKGGLVRAMNLANDRESQRLVARLTVPTMAFMVTASPAFLALLVFLVLLEAMVRVMMAYTGLMASAVSLSSLVSAITASTAFLTIVASSLASSTPRVFFHLEVSSSSVVLSLTMMTSSLVFFCLRDSHQYTGQSPILGAYLDKCSLRKSTRFLVDPGNARGCSTNTYVIHSVMVCENIFMGPPRPNG